MVKLLTENKTDFPLALDKLKSLTDVGIAGGDLARRGLNKEHVLTLILSDPKEWPPILVTKTDAGYAIIDGYHRLEAARAKKLASLQAISKAYKTENDVVEATFQANLKHGLKSSAETRSDYAYWLHKTYPDMDQKAIAERAGITQPSVSIAIARREQWEKAAAQEKTVAEPSVDGRRELFMKTCRSLTRDAIKVFDQIGDLDERELVQTIHDSIKRDEDREKIARVVRLLQESLKPAKAVARKR